MSHPLRIEFPGAVYHMTARGDPVLGSGLQFKVTSLV